MEELFLAIAWAMGVVGASILVYSVFVIIMWKVEE